MTLRRLVLTTATCAALATGTVSAQRAEKPSKEQEAKRPKFTLRAQPQVGVAPARISFTAELTGGSDDFEEYYCPTIEWEWGDGTTSESKVDCDPYEPGKSQIRRRYSIQHQFRIPGAFRVYIHLKQKDRVLGSATTTIQVQPGLSGPF
jgi:hypothetical protein